MTFQRPDLVTLRARIQNAFASRLPGADATLRRRNLGVVADVLAGLSHGHHGFMDYLALQLIPDTATEEFLERHADIWGVQRRLAAFAEGGVIFTGADGTALAAGSRLRRIDGAEYELLDGIVIDGPTLGQVRAREAGAAGNVLDAVALRLAAAVPGIDSEAAVSGGIVGGADQESDDLLRERLLLRIQLPPQGGAIDDYRQWALEVPGVTRVWVAGNEMGAGSVTVRVMMDEVRAAFDGVPQGDNSPDPTGDLAVLFDYIDERRPITAELFVAAPVLLPVPVTIRNLDPDTAEVRAAVEAGIAAMITRLAEPGGTIQVSKFWEAVSLATGETSHEIIAPGDPVVSGLGDLAVLGAVTYE